MRKLQITIYKFDELSELSRIHAMNSVKNINVLSNEWQQTFAQEAQDIGLDLFKRNFIFRGIDTARMIIDYHKPDSDTEVLARNYINKPWDQAPTMSFLSDLLFTFDSRIQQEYEYKTSNHAVLNSIYENDIEFTINGNKFNFIDLTKEEVPDAELDKVHS